MEKIKQYLSNPAIAAGALLGVLALVGVSLWLILGSPEDDTADNNENTDYSVDINDDVDSEDSEYSLTSSDVVEIENNVVEIVSAIGNYGVDKSIIQGEFRPEEQINDDNFTSRYESYQQALNLITDNSDLNYPESRTSGWDVQGGDLNAEVDPDSIFISDISNPITVSRGSETTRAVDVTVSWEGNVYFYEITVSDTSWDGSYYLLEKNYKENNAILRMVETTEGWRLFNIGNVGNIEFTSLWDNPVLERILDAGGFETTVRTEPTQDPVVDEVENPPMDPDFTPPSHELDDVIESDIDDSFRNRLYAPPIQGEDERNDRLPAHMRGEEN